MSASGSGCGSGQRRNWKLRWQWRWALESAMVVVSPPASDVGCGCCCGCCCACCFGCLRMGEGIAVAAAAGMGSVGVASKAKQHKARKKTAKKPAPASPTGTAGSVCAADSLGRAGCYAQRILVNGVQPGNEPHTTANLGKRMVELLLFGISGLLWDSNQGPRMLQNKYAAFRLPSWSPTLLVLTKLDHA